MNLTFKNGTAVRLYSPQFPSVQNLHFRWMADYNIDGAFAQRFVADLSDPVVRAARDRVALNVAAAAEAHGRVFLIEYDLSGVADAAIVPSLTTDWAHLTRDLKLTASTAYLHHRGAPAVVVWGLGFNDEGHPATPATARAVQALFATAGVTLIGGVPTGWRTRTGDAQPDPAWDAVYAAFSVVHPWLVGRFPDDAGADRELARNILPDAALCQGRGQDYLPVVWPGFSWSNMGNGPLNQIPRRGGAFLRHQLSNVLNSTNGSISMVFGAMFDEWDEGTAMAKIAATKDDVPAQGNFIYAGIDGGAVPGDTWLRLLGDAAGTLHARARAVAGPTPPQGAPFNAGFCSDAMRAAWKICDASAALDDRAADIVARLSLTDKINLTLMGPVNVSLPGLDAYTWWSEATHGVDAAWDSPMSSRIPATNFPLPISTSCAYNVSLWMRVGNQIGREARAMQNNGRNGNTYWAPVLNIVRPAHPKTMTPQNKP